MKNQKISILIYLIKQLIHQIKKIYATDIRLPTGEREADATGREEEGYEEGEVDERQVEQLAGVPDDLQRVERHALRKHEATDHRQAEEQRAGRERLLEPRLQPAAQERDERAAGAVTQQREADDHPGKVVPLHDRQHAHQQDLVTNRRRGNQQRGWQQAPHGL